MGLVAAEAVLAVRRSRGVPTQPALVRAAWLTAGLASNAPDADIVLSALTEAPYGYLLHHRGHTHTLVLAPLVGLLSWGLSLVVARRSGFAGGGASPASFSRADHALLVLLGTLGALLHIGMDAANSYGVHPFWPLNDHWYAADLIFIVEPLWWLALAIPLSFSVQARWARLLLLGIAGLGLLLSLVTGYVSGLALGWLFALGVGLYAWSRRLRTDGARATLSLFATALMLVAFASGRAVADVRVRTALDGAFSHAVEADVILSPEPGNPLCWNALAVSEERGDLVLRRVHVSASSLHPVGLCRMPFSEETLAHREPIARSETDEIHFLDEVRTPLSLLRELNESDCRTQAFLQFSRAPFAVEEEGVRYLGDLRYDRGREGFAVARLPMSDEGTCPENLPPWEPWRADVLSGPLPEEEHRFEALDM